MQLFQVYFFATNLLIYLQYAATTTTTTTTNKHKDEKVKPNIILMLADDMGFDDISFRGSNRFLTPNIDALAYSGIILNNLYTPAMCTPSRAALLTGKYPISTGMQHYVITNAEPWSLPTNETTIGEIFQSNGYFTSMIGKWHQGMARKAFTPVKRGFDMHFGYLGAYIDYFDHTLLMSSRNYSRGHDLRSNFEPNHTFTGIYATDLFTDVAVQVIATHNVHEKPLFMLLNHLAPHSGNDDSPLQAPEEEIAKFAYIPNREQRVYAAMMSRLDQSVGKVVDALSSKGILDNTIILFLSDNGGPTVGMHATTASNYPLRGQKNSPWEGGIRSSAVIWSTKFEKQGIVWNQRIYMADILPTLAAAAGIQLPKQHLDGLNLWLALKYGYEAVEREIVHNIDDIFSYLAYMKGKWKIVNGTTEDGQYDGWLGAERSNGANVAKDNITDPRAHNYTQTVQSTTVWQQLHAYRSNSTAEHIEHLRAAAEIKCLYDLSEVNATNGTGVTCNPLEAPCLFDIDDDPCEQNNLYESMKNTKLVQQMLERVEYWREHARPPNNLPADDLCDPKFYDNEWSWWLDIQDERNVAISLKSARSPWPQALILSIFLLKGLI